MDYQQIILLSLIAVNTVVSIIASATGNKDLATKAEQQREKAINKAMKKHAKTQSKWIEEEKKLNELKGVKENATNT